MSQEATKDLTALFAGFDPDEFDLLVMDGYDDCIIGVVERCGQEPIVCYDKSKVIKELESNDMTTEEQKSSSTATRLGLGWETQRPASYQRTTHNYD